MTSIILTGSTELARKEYINNLCDGHIELIHLFADKSSITIKQVQELNAPLSIAVRLPRLVWIEEANLLTIPAQNALLKMLEEPPADTTFYLTLHSANSLLPTIVSRARLITLAPVPTTIDQTILNDLKLIMGMSPGDRLSAITKRDRSESIAWLALIESSLSHKLYDSSLSLISAKLLAKIARLALASHEQLLANCSVGLVTQNFYLTLPHTRSTR